MVPRIPIADLLPRSPFPAELKKLGEHFFVVTCELVAPMGPMRTASDLGRARTLEMETFVMPVVAQPGSQLPFVSIGRLDGNDIEIADISVSKFHAFVRVVDGVALLLDANSKNGTFVNDAPVATRRAGAPTALKSGDRVRFGSVSTSFIDAAALHTLVRTLDRGRTAPRPASLRSAPP